MFHVNVKVISRGKHVGGVSGPARYLAREEPDRASQAARYLDGTDREDLVASGEAHLPAWAKDKQHFWLMADRYERHGSAKRPGELARHVQVTLPRELSAQGRLDLAEDIRRVYFERYPHSWAIHNPPP
jgi:hypothetical protein